MSQSLVDAVAGIVHEPTQTEGRGVDLTLAAVYEVTEPGRVDFGGGELEDAGVDRLETERRNADDTYGWWNLEAGRYLVEYNESLDPGPDQSFVVQTRREIRVRGAFHPTLHVSALSPVPLVVGGAGIRLKENARVSTVIEG